MRRHIKVIGVHFSCAMLVKNSIFTLEISSLLCLFLIFQFFVIFAESKATKLKLFN